MHIYDNTIKKITEEISRVVKLDGVTHYEDVETDYYKGLIEGLNVAKNLLEDTYEEVSEFERKEFGIDTLGNPIKGIDN